MKILFVCTGNICRSPTAEAVLRHRALREKLDHMVVDSAGTHGYHIGEAPDIRAIKAAHDRGISMKGIRARKVTINDFYDFDYVIAMDQGHYEILKNLSPDDAKARLSLFLENNQNVPDPYYGDDKSFENVFDIIQKGVDDLFMKLD